MNNMPTIALELPSVAVLKEVIEVAGELAIFYFYKKAANYFILNNIVNFIYYHFFV